MDFGGIARLRYVDFDSEELAEYPDVYHRVVESRDLEPGSIRMDGKLVPIWDVPYAKLVQEFESLGAARVRKAS